MRIKIGKFFMKICLFICRIKKEQHRNETMLLHDESKFPVSADYNFAVGSNLIAPGIDRTTFHSDSFTADL